MVGVLSEPHGFGPTAKLATDIGSTVLKILAGMMLAAAYSWFVCTIVPRNAWCDYVTVWSSHG
jgi:hypothetical protein